MSNVKEIKTLVAGMLENRSNVKKIPDLITALDNLDTVRAALNGLAKVFTHLIRQGDFKPVS